MLRRRPIEDEHDNDIRGHPRRPVRGVNPDHPRGLRESRARAEEERRRKSEREITMRARNADLGEEAAP
jgi:hypothetical protein